VLVGAPGAASARRGAIGAAVALGAAVGAAASEGFAIGCALLGAGWAQAPSSSATTAIPVRIVGSIVALYGAATDANTAHQDVEPEESSMAVPSVLLDELERTGDFAEYGRLTLRALVHYLRSHDYQHLAGMHWLVGKIASARS
jgi:hypothetical protein